MAEAAPVVTLDGPIGTGKGTISGLLAERLGFAILDSGAIYRALALSAQRRGIERTEAHCELAATLDVRFEPGERGDPVRVILDGEDVSGEVRRESCGAMASRLAVEPSIRAALLERQRAFRRAPGLVADGRDMGTVVFPDAEVKIYLTASPEERARRRYKQLIGKGIDVNLCGLLADIEERDKRDRERATAPLKPASDAVVIDTTGVDIEAVLKRVMEVVTGGLKW